jgi:hypothetical protein
VRYGNIQTLCIKEETFESIPGNTVITLELDEVPICRYKSNTDEVFGVVYYNDSPHCD